MPDAELVYHLDDHGATSVQLQRSDGTWARAPLTGPATVTYGGTPDLWDRVEDTWAWWNANGRPAQDRFGYARRPEGDARVWHIPTGRRWDL
ncbi:hypothetical protein [Streptomyces sp. bgisy100]|uniref:hypothetical protein n=1 Tax=Streptomyces sp. bgisy100 TaxID=3413783 RepID=UPI003D704C11